jgi:hypothetical protein
MKHKAYTEVDTPKLKSDIEYIISLGFCPPKWSFEIHVSLSDLIPCYKAKRPLEADIVAYKDGVPVIVFERDGGVPAKNGLPAKGHSSKEQRKRDKRKDHLLNKHGIRVWRWWNSDADAAKRGTAPNLRRDIKARFYAPYGSLLSDYSKKCKCTERGRDE